nr:type VII secretion protein EccE [Gordonia araii]
MRWDGRCLVTVVRLDHPRPAPRVHEAGGSEALTGDDCTVNLAVLQDFRRSCPVPVEVDLVVTEHRYCGAGPLASAYRATLGPLPIAAVRRVVAVLRIPVTDLYARPRNEGSGSSPSGAGFALRAATVMTRRLAARLAAHGMRATVCSADHLAEHTDHLVGPRLFPRDGRESFPLDVQAGPNGVSSSGVVWRTFALRPDCSPAALAAVAADDAVSTTTILRLTGPVSAPRLHGLFGTTEIPGVGRVLRSSAAAMDPLPKRQLAALHSRLPGGASLAGTPELPAGSECLRHWRFRVGDDGPIIGADPAGRAVTLPLFSSARHPVEFAGGQWQAGLLLGRCIAAGAAISVHTAVPARWQHLLTRIDDPCVFALGAVVPGSRAALIEVDLFDESTPEPDAPYRFRLTRAGSGVPVEQDAAATTWARIDCTSEDPSSVAVALPGAGFDVATVAAAPERDLAAVR